MPAKFKPISYYKKIGSKKGLPKYLYHATKKENLESIKDFGLVRGFLKGVSGWRKDTDFIWPSTQPTRLKKWLKKYHPGPTWITVKVYTSQLDTQKIYLDKSEGTRWYLYKGDIPPEALKVIG